MSKQAEEEQLAFLDSGRIIGIINQLKESEDPEKIVTIQIQVNLKGFDPRKDNKVSKDMVLPYRVRSLDKTIVIADEAHVKVCIDANLPYVPIDEISGDDKKDIRESVLKKNKFFILCPGYNKIYQLKNILRCGKTPHILRNGDDINAVFETGKKSCKLRIQDDFSVTSFTVGHTGMDSEHIYENIKVGMGLLVSYLKNGSQNLKGVMIKTDQSPPVTLY
ncbi:60S RIBOSOMAL PROTEIN L10A (L1 in yeast) [Encephalitozoon cuniculi GB-M1]|uniref:Large ribosomal subunit protein uL1 n=1 Tax=Encephalitozoon cuniculi (strain GB-M1) TaxID=284813 RepID=RL1_ENCCU|nr:ribosomal protein L1 domain-containing protein [Encephalitozoon cuniculi GB-M1]Q8SRY5.1 RecName: Full=Large ribosomal subunit protein uL1; AltName: Full=60S ribosomal protein L1; AltName: Full=L10a [Encephalitozoon cuniculi GB-M1]7QEP_L1 Chain L1, 60S ribosomal protein L1 [Encephalitozoon cuniculi GB-M1]CAD26579.1 60S RIBOSOMAL PROTEIN L10A (L1 in yeast) [Encephalitozoon cuniculi GB-M1]